MAAGVPVISTALGLEGLGATDGSHALVADTATEFAGQILALARDPEARQRLVDAAYELVAHRYSLDAVRRAITESSPRLGAA